MRRAVTLIELLVSIAIISVVLALLLPAIMAVRSSAQKTHCGNNLHQLGIGLHGYHQTHGSFPSGCNSRQPLQYISWMNRILPFVEQDALWKQTLNDYAQNPKFWSPRHSGTTVVLSILSCPAVPQQTAIVTSQIEPPFSVALTDYLGVAGKTSWTCDGVLYCDSTTRMANITDGMSNTLAVGERPPIGPDCGWWYAGYGQSGEGSADMLLGVTDLCVTYRVPTCPKGPYQYGPGRISNVCDLFHFWSLHPNGANFLFCDGSIHFLPYAAAPVMSSLASIAGGEAVNLEF